MQILKMGLSLNHLIWKHFSSKGNAFIQKWNPIIHSSGNDPLQVDLIFLHFHWTLSTSVCIQLYYYKSDLMNRGRLKKLISLCLMFDEKKCQDRKGIIEHWYVYFLLIYCNLNHNLILNPKNVFQNLAIIPHSNKLFLTF